MLPGPGVDGGGGVGVADRWRAAAVTALTGFQSAMTRRTAGMRWAGDEPVGDDGQGEQDDEADARGRLGALAHDAEAAAGPGQGVGEEQEQAEAGEDRRDAGVGAPAGDQAGGAWSRRPCWLWWMGPDTNGRRAWTAAVSASVSVTSRRAPPVCVPVVRMVQVARAGAVRAALVTTSM